MVSPLNLHIEGPLRTGGFISLDYAGPIDPALGAVVDAVLAITDEDPANRPQPVADGGADDEDPAAEVLAGNLDTSAPPSPNGANVDAVLLALNECDGVFHDAAGAAQRELLAIAGVDLPAGSARQLVTYLEQADMITRDRRGPKTYTISITDAGRRHLELAA